MSVIVAQLTTPGITTGRRPVKEIRKLHMETVPRLDFYQGTKAVWATWP